MTYTCLLDMLWTPLRIKQRKIRHSIEVFTAYGKVDNCKLNKTLH